MPNDVIISLTRALPGQREEFEAWFDEHLVEVLKVDGILSARRFEIAHDQLAGAPTPEYEYLAIYEVEGDKERIWNDLVARRVNGLNVPKRGIDDALTKMWAFEETTSLLSS